MTIRLPKLGHDEAMDDLATLTARRDEINKTADPVNTYAYWRAKRNISKSGGQDYEVDEKGKS